MRLDPEPGPLRDPDTKLRRWALLGLAGLLVLVCAMPLYDAWVLNRAGVLINRVIVAEAADDQPRTRAEATAWATKINNDLDQARKLVQGAAWRGPNTAGREIHIWRTYGAAAALSPSKESFALLVAAGNSGWLDRIGQLWLGEVATATGHLDEATKAYSRVDASNLLSSQGDSYLESGKKDLAVQHYRLARISHQAAMQRDNAESLLRSTSEEGQPLTAGLTTSSAERVTELYRVGKGLLAAGEPAEALPVLEQALQQSQTASPGSVIEQSLRLNLALALARTLPRAPSSFVVTNPSYYPDSGTLAYLQAVIRIRGLIYAATKADLTASVCVQAARTLLAIGDEEEAVSFLHKAVSLDPLMPDGYLMLGDWYETKGMKLLPFTLYEQAIKQLPSDTRIQVAYALASYKVLPPLESLPILQHAAQTSTTDPYLFATLGDCCLRLGLVADAYSAYEEGLRRAPQAQPLLDRMEELDNAVENAE